MKRVVIIGGSVTGLITALALARDGHSVTVLEKDGTPTPRSQSEAFEQWQRRDPPQLGQSHAFLARMHNEIRDREPELLRKLLASGAEQLSFHAQARQYFEDPVFEPEDDELVLLACRRITFEWVLRRHVLDTGLVELRLGTQVKGLVSERDDASGLPHVSGVELVTGDVLSGDLVVDASGRRTQLPRWLAAIGAAELSEDSRPCGIFYSTRFYRLNEGVERPNKDGIIGSDLGYLKFGIFPADEGVFSITLAAAPDDDPMRSVLRTPGFEAATRALPRVREWVDPEVSHPISEARGMADLRNTRRSLVVDGAPIVLGLIAIGDALIHANPITGRGCSLAWVSAYALADAIRAQPADDRALLLDLEAVIERELAPWLRAQMRQDEDSTSVNAAQRRGEDPYQIELPDGSQDPRAYIRNVVRDGLMPAIFENIDMMRTFMRIVHMLDVPDDLLQRPEVMQCALATYERRHEREPRNRGPSRDEMLEILAATA